MRIRYIKVLAFFLIASKTFSQTTLLSTGLIVKLDSVRGGTDKASHFGDLYFKATIDVDNYIQSLPQEMQLLMKKLEDNFAAYFFLAADANNNGYTVPGVWKNYFNDKQLSSLQLKLMGANAHINGDIWQAIRSSFTLEEIQKLKPVYKNYGRSLNKVFDDLFQTGIRSNKKLHRLHLITFGFDKVYGKVVLHKWRKRQLKLAIFNFSDPNKFSRLKKRTDRKREKIDRMIIKWLGETNWS
jgi:hypothetical protein